MEKFREWHDANLSTEIDLFVEMHQRDIFDALKFKEAEHLFLNYILQKLAIYDLQGDMYLFFDIDHTIAVRKDAYDIIRPSLPCLLTYIRNRYPSIKLGICSARPQASIDEFITTYQNYGFEIWYSSENFSDRMPDESRWNNQSTGHYNKAHAMMFLSAKYAPITWLLIDVVIWEAFEDKKMVSPLL